MKSPSIIVLLVIIAATAMSCGKETTQPLSAKSMLEAGEEALEQDSVVRGERLLKEAFIQAEKEADWHTCYIACQRMAQALSWSNTEEALRWAMRAVDIYEQHPDDERNHIILLDYAGTYAAQLAYNTDAPLDSALLLTERAYNMAVEAGETDLQCQTLTSLANIRWAMDDFASALDLARKAEKSATPELLQSTLQVLARCYLSVDSLPQAEAIYRRMETEDDIHAAYIVQSNLAKIALRQKDTEAAEAAIDSTIEEAEALYFKALEQKDEYYQALMQQQREQEQTEYTASLHRRTLIAAIVLLAALFAATVIVLRYRLRMSRQQRQHEEEMHKKDTAMLRQQAESQQTQLAQAAEVVQFLQNFILQRSEVVQKLTNSKSPHISLSFREWADVERTLNAIDSNLFVRLRKDFPELRDEDIQLCILTRLGLSNRTIGNIYGLTVSAVQHRKLKLKKDIFGEPDPDTTLEQVLQRLNN